MTTTTPPALSRKERRLARIVADLDARAQQETQRAAAIRAAWKDGPAGVNISCGHCGHMDDASRYYTDSFGQLRPENELQCPRCHWAVKRTPRSWGIELVPIQPTF